MAAYKAIIQKRDRWWVGWVEEIPGVNSQGATREELLDDLRSALEEAIAEWRQRFSSFLSRLATDSATQTEWLELVVTHYRDEELESIRNHLVRLSIKRNPTGVVDAWLREDRQQMFQWAEQLKGPVRNVISVRD